MEKQFEEKIKDELTVYCNGCTRETTCKKKTCMIFECSPNNCFDHIIKKFRTAEQNITSLSKINEQLETQIKSERKKRHDAEARAEKAEAKLRDAIEIICGLCVIVNPHHKGCTSCNEVDALREGLIQEPKEGK